MGRIKGTKVILWNKVETGTDEFHRPTYDLIPTEVENVLIGEPSPNERIEDLNLSGRHLAYTLGIPKGDTNEWENQIVEFFGHKWQVYGIPVMGIEENIPLSWHKKVKVERYGE